MVFKKTIAAAKVDAFAVVAAGDPVADGGFLLTEDSLTNIESAFANAETAAANAQTDKDTLQGQLTASQAETNQAKGDLAAANTRIENQAAIIADLKKGGAQAFSANQVVDDPEATNAGGNKNKYHTSYDDDAAKYSGKK